MFLIPTDNRLTSDVYYRVCRFVNEKIFRGLNDEVVKRLTGLPIEVLPVA